MKTVEELVKELKEEMNKDMPFARYRLLNDTVRMLEQLANENRVLRNTVDKLSKRLRKSEGD